MNLHHQSQPHRPEYFSGKTGNDAFSQPLTADESFCQSVAALKNSDVAINRKPYTWSSASGTASDFSIIIFDILKGPVSQILLFLICTDDLSAATKYCKVYLITLICSVRICTPKKLSKHLSTGFKSLTTLVTA